MAPSIVHLPNGQTLTVTPVFGGLGFRSNDLNTHHHNPFPPGWTIILHSEDDDEDHFTLAPSTAAHTRPAPDTTPRPEEQPRKPHSHRYKAPTLRNDHLFISSISNPSSSDFRPAQSPTRQIAMMLWATLWWYFHQPAPSPHVSNAASADTPEAGRPKGEWRININREGIFKGKHLLPKLERMGLIASEDSTVGLDPDDGVNSAGVAWSKMFVSQRSFWQLDPRIYLFSLPSANASTASPYPSLSPAGSRPASPNRAGSIRGDDLATHFNRTATPPGPFSSGSHLPTFYPPPPPQYTLTKGVRHPVRPKPPRQGETFYSRYIPSLGQYLTFRVACLGKNPVIYRGPTSASSEGGLPLSGREILRAHHSSDSSVPSLDSLKISHDGNTLHMSDTELLHKWMNDPRVSYSWAEQGPIAHQEEFLKTNLTAANSFPVIGCFDGKPFGYFELYWVKEDKLGAHLDFCDDYDRGIHCLVGENEFRGPHRIKVWLSALIHYCFLADMRTNTIMMEPRVDNAKLRQYCEEVGFFKEKEVTFAHKQSNLLKTKREAFEHPAL